MATVVINGHGVPPGGKSLKVHQGNHQVCGEVFISLTETMTKNVRRLHFFTDEYQLKLSYDD